MWNPLHLRLSVSAVTRVSCNAEGGKAKFALLQEIDSFPGRDHVVSLVMRSHAWLKTKYHTSATWKCF
jgi:hypothetical protein